MARRLCATLGSLLLPLNIASLGVPKKLLPINFHDMTFDILFVIPILICLAVHTNTLRRSHLITSSIAMSPTDTPLAWRVPNKSSTLIAIAAPISMARSQKTETVKCHVVQEHRLQKLQYEGGQARIMSSATRTTRKINSSF